MPGLRIPNPVWCGQVSAQQIGVVNELHEELFGKVKVAAICYSFGARSTFREYTERIGY